MPKQKTKRAFKKRVVNVIKKAGLVLVVSSQSGKKHNMRKRSRKSLARQTGTTVLNKSASKMMLKGLPYKI